MASVRVNLEPLEEFRGTFIGDFKRFGGKGGKKYTILLTNIHDEHGQYLCDHIWLNVGLQIKRLGHLAAGRKIQFNARVKRYRKGSVKRGIPVQIDYKFTYPSKVALVSS
mmetsp:Transcript_46258/g.76913  ORF Transcript_46258/g.76913 Transcript_46258/m.76913 type:complete len:110 (+) Transcript_46258:31-360(+)